MVRGVEGLDVLHVVRHGLDEDASAQAVLMAPADVRDGIIDVVEEDLTDAGPAVRVSGAPVGQPPIVGSDARKPQLVVVRRRGPRHHRTGGEKWRDRVGKEHLGDDAVLLELSETPLVIPVAIPRPAGEVLEGIRVPLTPGVELVEVFRFQVRAVLVMIASGMPVRRDQHEPVSLRCSVVMRENPPPSSRCSRCRRRSEHGWREGRAPAP